MEASGGNNLLETVLNAYNRQRHIDEVPDSTRSSLLISDSNDAGNDIHISPVRNGGLVIQELKLSQKKLRNTDELPDLPAQFGKRIPPSKPRRKSKSRTSAAIMAELDLGEPFDIQSIVNSVMTEKAVSPTDITTPHIENIDGVNENIVVEIADTDQPSQLYSTDSMKDAQPLRFGETRPSSSELEAECTRLMTSETWFDDTSFASDGPEMHNMSGDEDLVSDTAADADLSKHILSSSSKIYRRQLSDKRLNIESRMSDENESSSRPLESMLSQSVQSDLNLVGVECSPRKRFNRFRSTRYKGGRKSAEQEDKSTKKEIAQFLDVAASNASNAYAKIRQFKKDKIRDIKAKRDGLFDVSPKKGTPTKTNGVRSNSRVGPGNHRHNGDENAYDERKNSSQSSSSTLSAYGNDKVFNASHQRVLRSGWLKKQGGMIKTWNERWFVLRGDVLFYYKDKEENKLLGTITLRGNEVVDHPNKMNEPNKYFFEIIPGGDKENLSKNHNSYMMSTTTQNDKEEWLRVMKKVMKGPPGGGIFGQELMRTIQYEEEVDSKSHNGMKTKKEAPYIIIKCCEFIRQSGGFYEEGLFRLPGQANEVKELQDSFDMGERPDFDKSTDVHTVTSLMKSFLRELPEPLVPFNLYSPLIDAAKVVNPGSQSAVRRTNFTSVKDVEEPNVLKCRDVIKSNLQMLPKANFDLLRYLCRFLDEVQQHSERNKMDVANLALMFGPNIMRAEKEDPMAMMSDSTYVQYIMSEFIQNHIYFFPDDDPSEVREIMPQSSIPDVAADAASRHLRNNNVMTPSPITSPRYHNAFTDTTAQTSTEGFNTMTTQTTTSPPGTMGLRHVTDDSGTGSLGPTPDNTSRRIAPPHLAPVKHRNGGNRPKPASAIYEEVHSVVDRPSSKPALPMKPTKPLRPGVSNDVDRRQSFYDNVTQSSEASSFAGKRKEWRRSDEHKFNASPSQRSSYVNQTSPGVSSTRSSTNAVAGSSIAESFNSFDIDTFPYSPTQSVHEGQVGRRVPLNDVDNPKGPKPPARKRRSKKNSHNNGSPSQQLHNKYASDEESNTESVPPDDRSEIRSIRSSRNGSLSSINDHPRGYRSNSAPKRPTSRPPPPPYPAGQRTRSQTQDRQQTYEELQEDYRILQDRFHKQSGEYEARTRFMEEQLIRNIQELRSTSLNYCDQQSSVFRPESGRLSSTSEFEISPGHYSGVVSNVNEDSVSYRSSIADTTTSAPIQHDTVTGKYDTESQSSSPKEFKTSEEHVEYLQKCVTEERKLRQMTEIELKNEKRGRLAAEERNNQLQKEMKEFFFTFGSMFSNSETSSVR